MAWMTALLVGLLIGTGVYLILKRNPFNMLLGFSIFSYGINLSLLAMSGWRAQTLPPLLPEGEAARYHDPATFMDPLPQALILTALVIGFGLMGFLILLVYRRMQVMEQEGAREERIE